MTAIGGRHPARCGYQRPPRAWITNANYFIVISVSVVVAISCRRWWLGVLQRPLLFFDTLGIGIYTILGLEKALAVGVNTWVAMLLYVLAHALELPPTLNFLLSVGVITGFRLLAVRKGWSLPPVGV